MPCTECGGPTVWDDAASSDICTQCGNLADPAQVILTSSDWHTEGMHHDLGLRDPAAPNFLKTRSNYTLAGQGQGIRDQKNALTMANFIKSLAVSMNAPGLTPRATVLFNQARAIGYFRWGSRARTVAGVCLSLALRESNRPDSIHDIATLLRCSHHLLSRTFISLAAALKITTITVDPSVYIATLQSYLTTILQDQTPGHDLPTPLLASLRQLSLLSVSNTAAALGRTLARSCPSDGNTKSSAASTACAIFMLSLEAESRDTLGSIGDLAKCLAARCHVGKGVVMSQYKIIQDQVALLIEKVPWLEGYRQKGGRAKLSKRLVVARGLKDVIRFNEEILQNTLLPDPLLQFDSDDEKDVDEDHEPEDHTATTIPSSGAEQDVKRPFADADVQASDDDRAAKRRKIHHSLDEASRFLLNPFNAPAAPKKRDSAQAKPSVSKFPLTSYVLSTASLSSVGPRAPTRLQLLAAARGGSDEDAIKDEELFAEGELEGFLRNDEEVEMFGRILQYSDDDDDGDEEVKASREAERKRKEERNNKRKRVQAGTEGLRQPVPKKSRVNLEAFAKFMQGEPGSDEDVEGELDHECHDGDQDGFSLLGLDSALGLEDDGDEDISSLQHIIQEEDDDGDVQQRRRTTKANHASLANDTGEEIILQLDDWRPASPTDFDSYETRYEQEYD
ncbi:hypothetical protein DFP72DRAFT_985912 [Ephemerocybe angulata]|uniref:B-related factor 1 n=1 Tax=Ephemerocybe angulata TaxID=980116 RepID=A0A8H6MGH0_9AGAR|nr:hypothetical protein DFP72DRAFT_985912 [Tulosesus angulatus]